MRMRKGISLAEIIIVLAILAILVVAAIGAVDPIGILIRPMMPKEKKTWIESRFLLRIITTTKVVIRIRLW